VRRTVSGRGPRAGLIALVLAVAAISAPRAWPGLWLGSDSGCGEPPAPDPASARARPGDSADPESGPVQYRLSFDVRSTDGKPLEARVSILGNDGAYLPAAADTSVLAHAGYCYPRPGAAVLVPAGITTFSVSRGPEWIPVNGFVILDRDSTVQVRMSRLIDLRPRGIYSSELHAHSNHAPLDFTVTTAQARRQAKAEDIAVMHLLDQNLNFTGAASALSDDSTLVYNSFEHRNQTYGHVDLPGLKQTVIDVNCLAPAEPWPMLRDLALQVAGPGRALFVLAHPHTTDDYSSDRNWPGAGNGREYPVIAALGGLDGFDVVSYSNDPDPRWADWYDALSSGLTLTPTAGSDAVLNWFTAQPPGGWRVYADLGTGARLDYSAWLEAVRAGHTFVTSLPLLPKFRVGGRAPGEALEVPGDSLITSVTIEAECVTALTSVSLVTGSGTVWSINLGIRHQRPTRWDSTFTLRIRTPGWIALRADGFAGHRMLLGMPAVAHTNAVRVLCNGWPRVDPLACGRMADRLDQLQDYLDKRGGWSQNWHRDSVYSAINQARALYGRAYPAPPSAFQLLSPVSFRPVADLEWSASTDNEPGDHVRYLITVSTDSLFNNSTTYVSDVPSVASCPVPRGVPCWWRIKARDRAGTFVACAPATFKATLTSGTAGVGAEPGAVRLRAWPNPSRGAVWLEGLGVDARIVDAAGREVARPGAGLRSEGRWQVWDGRVGGRHAPPGVYRAVSRAAGRSVAVVVVE
jgi:hypothetical protein